MKQLNHSKKAVKVGFTIDGEQHTLLMTLRDARNMDAVLLGERVRFRLATPHGSRIGFYFLPEDFFVWKRSGFEALFHTLQKQPAGYSCAREGRGFIGHGTQEGLERIVSQEIKQAA